MMERYEDERDIEYAGNRFHISRKSGWYRNPLCIHGTLEIGTDTLTLPETLDGEKISEWTPGDIQNAQAVRHLEIPASYTSLELRNNLFPNLESVRIDSGSQSFSAKGTMICSANGKELYYCMSDGLRPTVVLPSDIHALGGQSFRYTMCEEILYENPAVRCENPDTFLDSVWWERQGPVVLTGNLFFRLKSALDTLELPGSVRRYHPQCFRDFAPKILIAPIPPTKELLPANRYYSHGQFSGTCSNLTLTSPTAVLKLPLLRTWYGLKTVTFLQPHKLYSERDGVLYSKDGKTLLFYPMGRTEEDYHIPEGTVKIAPMAFAGHEHLKRVYFPNSTLSIGMGAFCGCKSLEKVIFPGNLRTIPDASVFQSKGVFQDCKALRAVTLPEQLRYLGSKAFLNSGVEFVGFGPYLEEIGDFALYTEKLEKVSLPASVKRVHRGALMGVKYVEAYEGSASGLIAAINAAPPEDADTLNNLVWEKCRIVMLGKDGGKKDELLLPSSLKRTAAYHLELAWNGDTLDYEEYDACFEHIQDREEKLEVASARCWLRPEGEDNPYQSYLRHNAQKIGERLILNGDETGFLEFLRMGYLSESAITRLLKLSGENGMLTVSAYLLDAKKRNGKQKKSRFAL